MNQAVEFLKQAEVFYLATVSGSQPHVRPFGAVMEYKDHIYICTNNTKRCFAEMVENPKVEISAMAGGKWIRLSGVVAVDPSMEAKEAFLQECPLPMYRADDGIFEVLYFVKGTASICSFDEPPITFAL